MLYNCLQDAVDTTEDIALRTDVGKGELSGLTPAMRMAIMKNRIMKSAVTARTNLDSGEESPYSARIDSGLVTTERSRETQVCTIILQRFSSARSPCFVMFFCASCETLLRQ